MIQKGIELLLHFEEQEFEIDEKTVKAKDLSLEQLTQITIYLQAILEEEEETTYRSGSDSDYENFNNKKKSYMLQKEKLQNKFRLVSTYLKVRELTESKY